MRAEYDSTANAISIAIAESAQAEHGDEVHPRAIVALAGAKPVEVQLLYPDMGVSEPLAAVAEPMASTSRRCERPRSPRSRLRIEPWCSRSPPGRRLELWSGGGLISSEG
jgi:hypothetical protein